MAAGLEGVYYCASLLPRCADHCNQFFICAWHLCVPFLYISFRLNDKRVTAIEELGHMTGECASVLKQCSVTRVRVDDELCVGQMHADSERVAGRDHRVVVPHGHNHP